MALTALLVVRAKTKMLQNRQNGFSLIEVLIVLLIAGILLSFSIYSVNLLDKQRQNSLITQLQNQISSVKHKAQMLNFLMRIRHIVEKDSQRIVVEYFNVEQRVWLLDKNIKSVQLTDEKIDINTPFIDIRANGFITQSTLCVNDECVEIGQLVDNNAFQNTTP